MNHNGPAVEGVNVTRRMHRSRSRYFSQKAVTVQGGYGAIFAIPANQKVVQQQDLSRAEITSWIDDRKVNYHDKAV